MQDVSRFINTGPEPDANPRIMPITADAAITLFLRALTSLEKILSKAEAQIAERGMSVPDLLEARLGPPAPDMLSLASQVHWVAEGAKRTIERLLGAPSVITNDDAKTFTELHERIAAAIAYVKASSPSDVDAGLSRTIEIEHPRGNITFTGERFLSELSIPHLYFHLTCAYAILRSRGIELRMGDFLGFS